MSHGVPVYSPAYIDARLYCLVAEAMCVNHLPKVALDSAVASRYELAISNRKSSAITATPPSHTLWFTL